MTEESLYTPAFDQQDEVLDLDFSLEDDTLGLLVVGRLTDEIDIFGHKIVIRTLTIGQELEASLVSNKYRETDDVGRAYATAIVAACIESVDGRPLIGGLGPEEESLENRYRYIQDNWYWMTVRVIYEEYQALVVRSIEAQDNLKKA